MSGVRSSCETVATSSDLSLRGLALGGDLAHDDDAADQLAGGVAHRPGVALERAPHVGELEVVLRRALGVVRDRVQRGDERRRIGHAVGDGRALLQRRVLGQSEDVARELLDHGVGEQRAAVEVDEADAVDARVEQRAVDVDALFELLGLGLHTARRPHDRAREVESEGEDQQHRTGEARDARTDRQPPGRVRACLLAFPAGGLGRDQRGEQRADRVDSALALAGARRSPAPLPGRCGRCERAASRRSRITSGCPRRARARRGARSGREAAEPLQRSGLRREGGDVALPGREERLLARDHVAARARLGAQDEGLQRVRGGDDLLRRARLSSRIAHVADREQQRAEDRSRRGWRGRRSQSAGACRGCHASVASVARAPGRLGEVHMLVHIGTNRRNVRVMWRPAPSADGQHVAKRCAASAP